MPRPSQLGKRSSKRSIQAHSPQLQCLGESRSATNRPPSTHDSRERSDDATSQNQDCTILLQEVIMSLDMRDGATIGCSYYDTASSTLRLCQDIQMADLDFVEQLLIHIQPTSVLASGRAPERLLTFLEEHSRVGSIEPFVLRLLGSSEFSYDTAKQRLADLLDDLRSPIQATISTVVEKNVLPIGQGCIPRDTLSSSSQVATLMRCGSQIDLESRHSVACAGALLGDLHRRRSTGFLPDGQKTETVFHVGDVEMFSLSDYVFFNSETLTSLHILESESHPNSQAWGSTSNSSGSKESLSIYGLFHLLACTSQGRIHLHRIFLRPSLNLDVIRERQLTISLLLRSENQDRLSQLTSILRKIRNITTAVSQLHRGVESPSGYRSCDSGVWATLNQFTEQALLLREVLSGLAGGAENALVSKLVENIIPAVLAPIGDIITKTIDFEQSKSRNRSSVKIGVDSELDELKRRYDGMGSFLTEVVNHVCESLPKWATQYIRSCIFLPQLGFLVVVETDPKTCIGKYEGEGLEADTWERVFTTDDTACYKTRCMRDLDEKFGDMYCEIGDREVEILHDLAMKVLESESALVATSNLCGEFDAIMALAIGAEKYQWTMPQISPSNYVHIENGRHPLQELVTPCFIPNSYSSTGQFDSARVTCPETSQALVLTGPNQSGKSVYLKQVAIIVYLAHIGSFVPAQRAVIGLTDKILTRISTKESASRAESAFALDLQQVVRATKLATRQSLVLIDEFGKGTNSDDGAGLMTALIEHFLSSPHGPPRLLLATHFHEILEGRYLHGHVGLTFAHMEIETSRDASSIENQVTYLFNLVPGYNASSLGSRCAALNGVPSAVVARSEAMSLLIAQNEDLSAACARLSSSEERSLEVSEGVARRFLQSDLDKAAAEGPGSRQMGDLLQDILGQGMLTNDIILSQ